MSVFTDPSIADELSAIDCECRDCEHSLRGIETFYFDRGVAARIAQEDGGVLAADGDVWLRLHIEDSIPLDDGESPRDVLITRLEEMLAALKGGVA